jgi:hypothetical protein
MRDEGHATSDEAIEFKLVSPTSVRKRLLLV